MRPHILVSLLVLPGALEGQAASSDLWRVATGTMTKPTALAEDGAAPFWTPVVALPAGGARFRFAAEAVHGAPEVGVNGGILTFTARAGRLGTVNASYGQMQVGDIAFTETSPEAIGGTVPVWSQQLSLGFAGRVSPTLTAGVALRYLSGRTGALTQQQLGLDVGGVYIGIPHVRLGAATTFLDPTFGANEAATSYSVGAEARSSRFELWGASAAGALWYGATLLHGEDPQQLLGVGVSLGAVELDLGMAHESLASDDVWRSRFGVALRGGRYLVQIGRDGGVNDFGAAYRFGLTMVFR